MILFWIVVILGCFWVVYSYLLYPYWLSPLAKIPNGHPSAPFSSLWMHYKRATGKELNTVDAAFHEKGPIVRLGPNDLAVNTIDGAVRTVYGGDFVKTDWYTIWKNYGVENSFSLISKDGHLTRRRQLLPVFTKSYVQGSSDVMAILRTLILDGISPKIDLAAASGSSLNVLPLYMSYGLDFTSAYTFGLSRYTNFLHNVQARNQFLADYLRALPDQHMFWLREVPTLRDRLTRLGIRVVPDWIWGAHRRLEDWMLDVIDTTESALVKAPATSGCADEWQPGEFPVVYNQLKSSLYTLYQQRGLSEAETQAWCRLETASEFLDHINGTRDVFGVTFVCILYDISEHPHYQRLLQEELIPFRKAFDPLHARRTALPQPKELEPLPLLNAMIKESLRLRGTIPSAMPRWTPHGRSTTIAGYSGIQGGVKVTAYPWLLHRNEDVYAQANEWCPDRWLGTKEETKEQRKWFWAFGSGNRGCIGDHLAFEMMRYALAAIYTHYTTRALSQQGINDGLWVTGKEGDHLDLKFERICVEQLVSQIC